MTEEPQPKTKERSHRSLAVALSVLLGMLIGSSLMVINYAEGLAYLSNDPKACTNCHIMQPQYDGWEKSPHHAVATCNDCHVPHALLSKYIAKALNGWNHSRAFTLQNFEEPIQIKPVNAEILNENCRRCHETLVSEISGHYGSDEEGPTCTHCHASVGHGATR